MSALEFVQTQSSLGYSHLRAVHHKLYESLANFPQEYQANVYGLLAEVGQFLSTRESDPVIEEFLDDDDGMTTFAEAPWLMTGLMLRQNPPRIIDKMVAALTKLDEQLLRRHLLNGSSGELSTYLNAAIAELNAIRSIVPTGGEA
jgi:hypothetical protein